MLLSQTTRSLVALFVSVWLSFGFTINAFVPQVHPQTALRHAGSARALTKTTLDSDTTWNLRLVLRGIATARGRKVDEIFSMEAKFLEDIGYEPPQGTLQQVSGDRLQIVQSRWTLSEDPNDRKDGLWVWGLFQEPLYPYLLLKLSTGAIPLAGDEGDSIKPLQLYAQINHKREDGNVALASASELKIRQVETVRADPFGAASVDLYDDIDIGTLTIQPLVTAAK